MIAVIVEIWQRNLSLRDEPFLLVQEQDRPMKVATAPKAEKEVMVQNPEQFRLPSEAN